jgi:hypothetical protein
LTIRHVLQPDSALIAKVFDLISVKHQERIERRLSHGTAVVITASQEKTSAVEKLIRFFESAEHSPHSTGNIAQRVSISFQQKSFWAIEMDRMMGQRTNQVVLEKSSGA